MVLAELGHTRGFWDHRPQAEQRLLTAFCDRGVVDDSLFTTHRVDFAAGEGAMSTVALILARARFTANGRLARTDASPTPTAAALVACPLEPLAEWRSQRLA